MSINISVFESTKQIIVGIPEYITITIDQPATVFYTVDGTIPDPTGMSLTTLILETDPNNHFEGTAFLPKNNNFVVLNILAVGVPDTNLGTFYRRYGLDSPNIGASRLRGSAYTTTPSPNITASGDVITSDGYTEGRSIHYDLTGPNIDGYDDGYYRAISGEQAPVPASVYDHVEGYDGDGYVVATSTLTPGQELGLLKLSNQGNTFINNGQGLIALDDHPNIDPRSGRVIDSTNDELEVVPVEDYPNNNYTIDGYSIDDNFDNGPDIQVSPFSTGGIFDPHAAYIEIDGRIDGYINGEQIRPGDRVIINKPYGELRYSKKREDLGDALRTSLGYISGGLVTPIYDYNKGQAAFYYWDNHDYRWVVSLQKIDPPKYEIFARRNGVVVGQVFKWITGKRQVMPG